MTNAAGLTQPNRTLRIKPALTVDKAGGLNKKVQDCGSVSQILCNMDVMRFHYPYRRLHLVDAENLAGMPQPSTELARFCHDRYLSIAPLGGDDLVVVACNHGAGKCIAFEWPHARVLFRSGPDGADLALLDVFSEIGKEGRFDEIVIGSGDGIFAPTASFLEADGIPVTVISRRSSLSSRLRLAARTIIYFDNEEVFPTTQLRSA